MGAFRVSETTKIDLADRKSSLHIAPPGGYRGRSTEPCGQAEDGLRWYTVAGAAATVRTIAGMVMSIG